MAKLKVVALISGGKDSMFSMYHCMLNGHEIVALANLHPPPGNDQQQTADDIDSFMYQTIGHQIIPLYEQALGLPLYRQEIRGDAVNTSKSYGPAADQNNDEQDETESLVPLLQRVMQQHPEVNAVCSGAILSDYQRTRVESVATRLGLTSLAYLWQYPAVAFYGTISLLTDLAMIGQDSRIIKVSSGALDDSFLWKNVADGPTSSRLADAAMRFGDLHSGAALGEGGEYETITLRGPAPLWRGEIIVDEKDMEVVPGEAGSASVRISNAHVLDSPQSANGRGLRRIPTWIVEPFFALVQDLQSRQLAGTLSQDAGAVKLLTKSQQADPARLVGDHLVADVTGTGESVAEQTITIMQNIRARLAEVFHTVDDIAYTSIILRDINGFAAVNSVYAKVFQRPNPPSRMTLACAGALPQGKLVSISVTSRKLTNAAMRQGLHVQSISYWAPANIGPYSQAISLPIDDEQDDSIVYVAGQIPLVAASMQLVDDPSIDSFLVQAGLCLQHLHRIRRATSIRHWVHAIAFITASSQAEALERAAITRYIWSCMHGAVETVPDELEEESDDSFDVWFTRLGTQPRRAVSAAPGYSPYGLDNRLWDAPACELKVFLVDALPRQAQVEWVAFGTTSATPLAIVIPHYQQIVKSFAGQEV